MFAKVKIKDTILGSAEPASENELREWYVDGIFKSVDRFLERQEFEPLFFWLLVAANRDKAFKRRFCQLAKGLSLKRDFWNEDLLKMLVFHYAHAVLDDLEAGNPDNGRQARVYAHLSTWLLRVFGRDVGAIDNLVSRAVKATNPNELPDWARSIIEQRLHVGRRRKHRGSDARRVAEPISPNRDN